MTAGCLGGWTWEQGREKLLCDEDREVELSSNRSQLTSDAVILEKDPDESDVTL